jgi:hypothetical protein
LRKEVFAYLFCTFEKIRLALHLLADSGGFHVKLKFISRPAEATLMATNWNRRGTGDSGAAREFPNDPAFWAASAWAEHKRGRTLSGLQMLCSVAERFPRSPSIAYRLACLYGALHRLPEAELWFSTAIGRSNDPEKLKLNALEQPELKQIVELISGGN